jgi:hypothetical protein
VKKDPGHEYDETRTLANSRFGLSLGKEITEQVNLVGLKIARASYDDLSGRDKVFV